jgi:hypothetical protein
MYTPFWFTQLSILYDKHHLFEFFPIKEYDTVRKLNAILRLSIYYSILMYCYKKDTNIFAVPLITALVTYFMWNHNSDIQNENFLTTLKNDRIPVEEHNIGCKLPTKDNPFMNTPFFDVAADKELPTSCNSYDNKGIQRKIETEFDKGLYRNYTDIFGKENSQRQFFTVPGRGGIPDQSAFSHWLYRTPETCKEGNALACLSVGGNGGPSVARS